MMNPNEIKRLREWATLPILISVILFFSRSSIVQPVQEQLTQSLASFSAAKGRIMAALGERNSYLKASKRLKEVQDKMNQLKRWIPTEDYLPTIVDQLGVLSELFSVELLSARYQFENSRFSKHAPRVIMRLRLKAEYIDVCGFIQALECLPSPLVISEILASEQKIYTLKVIHMVKS